MLTKFNNYMMLSQKDYNYKLHSILDRSKFTKLRKNTTMNNKVVEILKINKIMREYQPGYHYGNVKP